MSTETTEDAAAKGLPISTDIPDWGLYQKAVPVKGRAVFPSKPIPASALVLRFEGPIYTRDTCPDFSEAIQVGLNAWMHSSGGLDDFVNHACVPNCGLYPNPADGNRVYLVSLREILPGEELSFDYSTSMVDEPWSMECACGEAKCRGRIANFLDLPAETQRWYASRGVLPEHVRHAYLTRGAGKAAAEVAIETASSLSTPGEVLKSGVELPTSTAIPDWGLYQKPVPIKGRAVFPSKPIPANELVLRFEGPIYTKETCPDFSEAIQVGLNAWMHSSGGLDDLVNHACVPNCGLYPHPADGNRVYLVSLRKILPGEELSFDYSTSMVDEPWSLEGCGCGEAKCRGRIANFLDLPAETQHWYASRGVLPEHTRHAYLTRGAGKGGAHLVVETAAVGGAGGSTCSAGDSDTESVTSARSIGASVTSPSSGSAVTTPVHGSSATGFKPQFTFAVVPLPSSSTATPDWGLYQKTVPVKGRAVFVGKPIPVGGLVIQFVGPEVTKDQVPTFSECIQIGPNKWVHSSGGLDDLINHSCGPNTGLYQHPIDKGLYLVAIKPIAVDDEITFDYSTSAVDEPWTMDCACGEATCRDIVTNFLDLPEPLQRLWVVRGLVPDHVLEAYNTRGAGRSS